MATSSCGERVRGFRTPYAFVAEKRSVESISVSLLGNWDGFGEGCATSCSRPWQGGDSFAR